MKKKHRPYVKLKRLFLSRGITYKDIAKVIGTTEATVMCKINGNSDFTVTETLVICKTFGIDPAVFFADDVA